MENSDATRPLSLFYSYSHRDEPLRKELEAHLSFLRRSSLIAEWHDRMIDAGDEWKPQIDHSIATADIVLLLVSADFIASDYCWGDEMAKALDRHERHEARVIPVILRPCRWTRTQLGRLQAVPKDGKAVSDWSNRDAAFDDIAAAIERTVEDLHEQRRRAAEQARSEADEARQRAQAEAARLAADVERRQAAAERRRAEAEAARRAHDEHQRAETEARRRAKEQERQRVEAEASRRAEEEQRQRQEAEAARKAEQERQHGEALSRLLAKYERERAETPALRQADEQERQLPETELARRAAQARQRAEDAAKAMSSETQAASATDRHGAEPLLWKRRVAAVAAVAVIAVGVYFGSGNQTPIAPSAERWAKGVAVVSAPQSAPAVAETFRDCEQCPVMVVVGEGSFTMGSPADEKGRSDDEGPRHQVKIPYRFAVGKYEITFQEWNACVAAGACSHQPDDYGWGKGMQPVVDVSWNDAREYVGWLTKRTGKSYRLLSEAEWEYASRARTTTRYPWGDEPGTGRANFDGSGSKWSSKQPATVGGFAANDFGLHDMIGNVWEWTQDCWKGNYKGAPGDGKAWESGDCGRRVVRGGSWDVGPDFARAASRIWYQPDSRNISLGFRLARTL